MVFDVDKTRYIKISVAKQSLQVVEAGETIKSFVISTGKNGCSEQNGSGGTPTGWHYIRIKVGTAADKNAVFVGRRETGEIYSSSLADSHPNRDWVLGRILWLSGLEKGKNRLGDVDTLRRYIYIHGTPDEEQLGTPASHGCIRMNCADVVELFSMVDVGTRVHIFEGDDFEGDGSEDDFSLMGRES